MGAIPWIIMSEIFPVHVRGLAGSVATLVNWSCSFAVTQTFQWLLLWSSPGGPPTMPLRRSPCCRPEDNPYSLGLSYLMPLFAMCPFSCPVFNVLFPGLPVPSCVYSNSKDIFAQVLPKFHIAGAFLLYALECAFSLLFIAYFVPETRGRTLEEIEASFKTL